MVGHVLLIPLKHVIDVANERKVSNIVVKIKEFKNNGKPEYTTNSLCSQTPNRRCCNLPQQRRDKSVLSVRKFCIQETNSPQ